MLQLRLRGGVPLLSANPTAGDTFTLNFTDQVEIGTLCHLQLVSLQAPWLPGILDLGTKKGAPLCFLLKEIF